MPQADTAERLQKVLAAAGVGSRRACEDLIFRRRVTVNGKVAKLGDKVDPTKVEILVDGQRIAEQEVPRTDPGRFYDATYAVPAALVEGKAAVTVKFQSKPGSQVAAVYGLRMVRADQRP